MILITKGTTNTIRLTLSEKCDLPVPHFLFIFKNSVNGEQLAYILPDTSLFTERYNKFTFIEPTTGELLEGFWTYDVYEQDNASNTDPDLASQLVETGVMKVVDSTTPTEPTTYEGETTTTTVYE